MAIREYGKKIIAMNEAITKFLESFLGLFGVTRITIGFQQTVINGIAYWDDEPIDDNFQHFRWKQYESSREKINRLTSLCDYIKNNKLNSIDKILMSETKFVEILERDGWVKNVAQSTIDDLCNVKIKMIDDGKETDSFFLHF